MRDGKKLPKTYSIIKDQYSDSYAVASCDEFADAGQKLIFRHYNKDHQLLYEQNLPAPKDGFAYYRLMDMVVEGDTAIVAATYSYDKLVDDIKSRTFLSRINQGGVIHHTLPMTNTYCSNGMLTTDSLHTGYGLLTRSGFYPGDVAQGERNVFLIDGKTYEPVIYRKLNPTPKPDKYRVEKVRLRFHDEVNDGKEIEYSASEGLKVYTEKIGAVDEYYVLKGIGIEHYRSNTDFTVEQPVFKTQQSHRFFSAGRPSLFSLHQWNQGRLIFGNNAGYERGNDFLFSYQILNTAKGQYAAYNDLPENNIAQPKEPLNLDNDHYVAYLKPLSGEGPARALFNDSEDREEDVMILTCSGYYDQRTSTYAVVVLENWSKKTKKCKVAWITL